MSYGKKYTLEFKNIDNVTNLVEIWENDYTGSTTEVIGASEPFIVEMPGLSHKFDVVRGTGCQINLLSESNMYFFNNLYHIDPQQFMIKHYIDSNINWLGYLNPELFSEQFDLLKNYFVQVTGNDGFSLMDRLSFLETDGTYYEGLKSIQEIIDIIFDKVGLPYTEYRIALSTSYTGYLDGFATTILTPQYVNCENFIDEDGKVMSCREVLEAILKPFSAFIRAENGIIYITDIHTIASNASITYKKFTFGTWSYGGTVVENNRKVVQDIGYTGTGQQISVGDGINRQVVSYSPYSKTSILPKCLSDLSEFDYVPSTPSTKNGYYYKTLTGNTYFDINYAGASFELSYDSNPETAEIYLRFPYIATNTKIATLSYNPYLSLNGAIDINESLGIKITGSVLVKYKNNPYDDEESTIYSTNWVSIPVKMKIGNYYYSTTSRWTTTSSQTEITTDKTSTANIGDQFTALKEGKYYQYSVWFPFELEDILLNGNFEFEIWSEWITSYDLSPYYQINSSHVDEIWLKDLKIEITDRFGNSLTDDDKEYIGELSNQFKNEGSKIDLIYGSNLHQADRGKITYWDYVNSKHKIVQSWTRNGQTNSIESLLLNSVVSNYNKGSYKLSNMKLNNSFSINNVITDNYLSNRLFFISQATIYYRNNEVECELWEINSDQHTIT